MSAAAAVNDITEGIGKKIQQVGKLIILTG